MGSGPTHLLIHHGFTKNHKMEHYDTASSQGTEAQQNVLENMYLVFAVLTPNWPLKHAFDIVLQ